MAKKLDTEMKEVPVIDPVAEVRKKVDEGVKEKIDVVIKEFQVQQDQGFEELENLQSQLEELEKKKSSLMAERGSLAGGIFGAGGKGVADIDMKIRYLEKDAKGLQKQVDGIFARLTELPPLSFPLLNFLTRR